MRIQYRKHGREAQGPLRDVATHAIKIGFDSRAKGDKHPRPGKLPGFVICRDTLGADGNNRAVDLDVMKVLGYSADMIERAKAEGLDAKDHLLPTELRFVLHRDAVRLASDVWDYPGIFSESFECWDQRGLFCCGDGCTAQRKQVDARGNLDGTRRTQPCNPVGKTGVEPEDFCPLSAEGKCATHARLIVLLYREGENGQPIHLSPSLGANARYRLDTKSGYSPQAILAELDAASNRLGGRIGPMRVGPQTSFIRGRLIFTREKKVRPDGGKGLTQQIKFVLDETDIAMREALLREALAPRQSIVSSYVAPLQLQAPADTDATTAIEGRFAEAENELPPIQDDASDASDPVEPASDPADDSPASDPAPTEPEPDDAESLAWEALLAGAKKGGEVFADAFGCLYCAGMTTTEAKAWMKGQLAAFGATGWKEASPETQATILAAAKAAEKASGERAS